jgi:hypothetical protein
MLGIISVLLIVGLLIAATWRHPPVAIAAILCLFGLKQWGQNSSPLLADFRTFANWAVAFIVIIGLIKAASSYFSRGSRIPVTLWLAVAMLLYAFATLIWSPITDVALTQWSLASPYLLMIVAAAPSLVRDQKDFLLSIRWTMLVGSVLCLLALLFGTWGDRGLMVLGDRTESQSNPLAIASLGGTIMVAAAACLFMRASLWQRLLYLLVAAIGLAVVLRSGSRGQLAAAAIALLACWPLTVSRDRRLGALVLLPLILGCLSWLGYTLWTELGIESERWTGQTSSEDAAGRLDMAAALLGKSFASPATALFGLSNSSSFYHIGFYPHIAALEVLAEEGLVGFILLCIFLAVTFRNLIRFRGLQTGPTGILVAAMLTGLFTFEFLLTFKQGTLISSTYVFFYGIVAERVLLSAAGAAVPAAAGAHNRTFAKPANLMR